MTIDRSDFEEAIRRVETAKREAIEVTAKRVLEAVKGAGVVSLMPNGALPLTGLLLTIHPDVYNRVGELSKNPETDAEAEAVRRAAAGLTSRGEL